MTVKQYGILVVLLAALSVGASGANVIDLTKIAIDPTYTSKEYTGFPIANMFGGTVITPEGNTDTIFGDSGSGYRNVFFHMLNGAPVSSIMRIVVGGAQDGDGSQSRTLTYFSLYSYTFGNINNPGTHVYTDLFDSGPLTPNAAGFEHVDSIVNLAGVGPYFVMQFGALDGSVSNSGPRIYDVKLLDSSAVPEPTTMVPLALVGAFALLKLRRRKA
jgi:hypothetical protein